MAEDRVINLEIKDNVKTLKQQYKEAVKELQQMAATYGEMSDEAVAAAKRAAELKDQIEDTNDLMQSFKGEGAFIAMNKAMTAVASGFSAIEGGVALAGVESEKLQETMVKLQAAMALAQGLEGLEDAGRAFSALKTKVVDLGRTALNAFQGMTTASKAFTVTGIGLVITGVALLISNWDKLTGKEKFNYDQFKQQAEEKLALLELQNQALDRQYNNVSKSSDDAIKGIEREIKIAELQGKNTDELYKRKSELIQKTATESIKSTEAERDAIKKRYAELEAVQGGLLENHTFYLKQKSKLDSDSFKNEAEKRKAAIDVARYEEAKALRDRAYQLRDFRNAEFDKAEAAEDDLKIMKLQKQKELRDKAKAARDADLSELRGYIKEANKLYSQSQMDDTEKAIDEIKRKYERQLKLAKKYNKGISEIETAMMNEINDIHLAKVNEQIAQEQAAREQARLNRIAQENELWSQIEAIDEDNFQRRTKKRMLAEKEEKQTAEQIRDYETELVRQKYFELETLAQGNAEQLAIIEEAKEGELYDINKKYSDKKKADKKAEIESITNMTLQGLDLIASIAEANAGEDEKRQRAAFNIRKASNIAQATVDGYKAVLSTYADTPGGIVVKTIAATIAGGFAALKIGQIAKSKYESSASGGGGNDLASGGTESFAPQFNVIGNSGINQLAQLTQQPVQAYVVSGEVTSAQALDRNRQKNATL